jgi:hypothetical protein
MDCHQEAPLEELPHVVGGVDLLHLHLRVDVAVGQKVDVSVLHLKTIQASFKMAQPMLESLKYP